MNSGKEKFEQDLKQVEDQYRALPGDEPPEMLDQAVLNKARTAVEKHAIRPWNFGWMHATATAALLVLGLTVVLQQPGQLTTAPSDFDQYGIGLDEFDAAEIDPNEIERGEIERIEIERVEVELNTPARTEAVSTSIAAGLELKEEIVVTGEALADSAESEEIREDQLMSVSDARQRESGQRQVQEQELAARAVESSSIAKTAAPGSDDQSETESQVRADNYRLNTERRQGFSVTAAALEPAAPPIAEAVERDQASPVTCGSSGALAGRSAGCPDEWIARIIEMKHQHESDDWKAELESFLESYPDYPLPEELNRPAGGE